MNIIKPYARLLPPCPWLNQGGFPREHGVSLLQRVEWFGRISHRSEDAQTEESWKRFIPAVVINKGDWSITEHSSVSVDMMVDRGITHEIVRHRLFSFTQESTRFVNYEKKMPPSFIAPFPVDNADNTEVVLDGLEATWVYAITACEVAYKKLLKDGVSPQIARSVFPNALASRITITGNLRNWRHFLIMRSCKEAHPQMREVVIPLLAEFQAKIPFLYDDITPEERQADAIKRAR